MRHDWWHRELSQSLDELRAVMETNFFGAIAVTRAALPILRAQRAGAIVNISSLGGQLSFPGFGAYSATKFAPRSARVFIRCWGRARTAITKTISIST